MWVYLFMRELVAAETVLFVSGTDVSAMSVCHLDLDSGQVRDNVDRIFAAVTVQVRADLL